MEQGLRLLIQCLLELAPVIAGAGGIEQEQLLQQQLAVYHRATQLKIAERERETALKLPELNKILENWPLRLYPSQILESHNSHRLIPLKIFLAPPKVQFEQFDNVAEGIPGIELKLAEGLREFLNKHYSLHNQIRPTEFLAGAWESKRFHSESSIKAMFGMLKSEPILILESEIDGDYLNFRIACWGLGQENYYYKTICRLPYREIVYQAAKARALEWREIRDELVLMGENLEEINKLGKDNVINLANLEKEETWKDKGIDVSKLSLQYQVNHQDFEKLCQVLLTYHCLVAGWVADAYHLVHYDVSPLLPELLPSLVTLGESQGVGQLEVLLSAIADLKRKRPLEHAALSYTLTGHSGKVSSVAISPDGQTLVSGCLDKTIKLWSLSTGKLIRTLNRHSGEISSVTLSPDGQFLATGSYDGPKSNVKVWNLNTGKLLHTLLGHKKPVNFVAINSDGQMLASGSNKIKVWHLHTGERLCTLWHSCTVNSAAISTDGTILASGSSDNKIRLWNPRTGELLRTVTGHSEEIKSIAISPNGRTLVSGSADKTIKIWCLNAGELLGTLTAHSGEVTSIAISPDGQTLVSGSADKTIKIWSLSTGKLLQTLTGHSDAVNSVALSPDGKFLASSSSDTTIKVWQIL